MKEERNKMLDKKEKREKSPKEEAEEIKEVLSVVSTEIPALIKNILASVFSEEAGRNMGKAAAAFYKELKESGIPDELALKMTENYMSTFTSLGDMLKQVGKGKKLSSEKEKELEQEIRQGLGEKFAAKMIEKVFKPEEEG